MSEKKMILLLSTNVYDCLTALKCLGVSVKRHRLIIYGNVPQEHNWLRRAYDVDDVIPRITDYSTHDAALVEEVLSICKERQIDVLLPTGFCSLKFLSYHREQLSQQVLVAPVPDYATIHQLDDKASFHRFCLQHGIPHPTSVHATAEGAVGVEWTDFPALVKPAVAAASRGIVMVANREELVETLKLFTKDTSLLIQEYLDGHDINFNGYALDGEILAYTIHTVREARLKGGSLKYNVFVDDPEVYRLARRVISRSAFSGPINMDFRYQSGSGKLYAIEVNPRFWSSTHHSLVEGINYLEIAIDAAADQAGRVPYRPAERAWIPLTKLFDKKLLRNLHGVADLAAKCTSVEWNIVLRQSRAALLFKAEMLAARVRATVRYKGVCGLSLLALKNLTKNILNFEKVYVLAKSDRSSRTEPSIKVNIAMAGKADIDMVEPFSYGSVEKRLSDGQRCYVAKYGDDLCAFLWASHGAFYPPDSHYYFDVRSNEGYIYDVRTLHDFKGLKIGPGMLERIADDFSGLCDKLYAVVVSDNVASLKMMERAGFAVESQMRIVTLFNRTISKKVQGCAGR